MSYIGRLFFTNFKKFWWSINGHQWPSASLKSQVLVMTSMAINMLTYYLYIFLSISTWIITRDAVRGAFKYKVHVRYSEKW